MEGTRRAKSVDRRLNALGVYVYRFRAPLAHILLWKVLEKATCTTIPEVREPDKAKDAVNIRVKDRLNSLF